MRPRWVIGGKAGGERKSNGRERKVKIARKTVNDGGQGNRGLLSLK